MSEITPQLNHEQDPVANPEVAGLGVEISDERAPVTEPSSINDQPDAASILGDATETPVTASPEDGEPVAADNTAQINLDPKKINVLPPHSLEADLFDR